MKFYHATVDGQRLLVTTIDDSSVAEICVPWTPEPERIAISDLTEMEPVPFDAGMEEWMEASP